MNDEILSIGAIIVVVIVLLVINVAKQYVKENRKGEGKAYLDYHVDSNGKRYMYVEHAVKAQDSGFHFSAFNEVVEKLFMKLLVAVKDGDTANLSMYINKHVVNQIQNVYEEERLKATSLYTRKIVVEYMDLADYYQKTATMDALIVDVNYVIKASEGDIKQVARLELERPSFVETPIGKIEFLTNCPNCGAAIDEKGSKICAYCGSILPVVSFDWIIVDIILDYKKEEKWGFA